MDLDDAVESSPLKPMKTKHQDGSASDMDFAGGVESEPDEDSDVGAVNPRELQEPFERSKGGIGSTPPKGMTKSVLSIPRKGKGSKVTPNSSARKKGAGTLTLSPTHKVVKRQPSAPKKPLASTNRPSISAKPSPNDKGKAGSSAKASFSSAKAQSAPRGKRNNAVKKPDENKSQRPVVQGQDVGQGNKNISNKSQPTSYVQEKKQEVAQSVSSKTFNASYSDVAQPPKKKQETPGVAQSVSSLTSASLPHSDAPKLKDQESIVVSTPSVQTEKKAETQEQQPSLELKQQSCLVGNTSQLNAPSEMEKAVKVIQPTQLAVPSILEDDYNEKKQPSLSSPSELLKSPMDLEKSEVSDASSVTSLISAALFIVADFDPDASLDPQNADLSPQLQSTLLSSLPNNSNSNRSLDQIQLPEIKHLENVNPVITTKYPDLGCLTTLPHEVTPSITNSNQMDVNLPSLATESSTPMGSITPEEFLSSEMKSNPTSQEPTQVSKKIDMNLSLEQNPIIMEGN